MYTIKYDKISNSLPKCHQIYFIDLCSSRRPIQNQIFYFRFLHGIRPLTESSVKTGDSKRLIEGELQNPALLCSNFNPSKVDGGECRFISKDRFNMVKYDDLIMFEVWLKLLYEVWFWFNNFFIVISLCEMTTNFFLCKREYRQNVKIFDVLNCLMSPS